MPDFSVDRYNWLGQEQYNTNEWVDVLTDLFGQLLGTFYEETDPVDDIDRIYRQEEAQAFNDLLDNIRNGSATWRDIANFEVYYLADVDGFQEFVDDMVDSAMHKGLYDDLANASTNEDFQRIFNEYGNAGIETNPYIQQDLASTGSAVSVVTGTVDNAILEAAIKNAAMGDGDLVGSVEFENLPGYGGIWEGFIRHIEVSVKGLGLPIPDWLPLPGIFDLPSIGEIFDTVTGPWKDASRDALRNCMDPDGDGVDDKSASQCLEEQSVIDVLVEGIGNATKGIWEATGGKVQDIFKEDGIVDRCTSNPSGCAQEVFDKLKDIFGEGAVDPTSTGGNIPDWMKVIIIGGAYGDEILGELEDLFGGDIDDDGTIGVGPEEPEFGYCQDGVTEKADAEGTNCQEYAEFGYCEDGTTKKQDAEGTNCSEYAPDGYCEDGVTKKDNPEGTNCEEYEPPLSVEEQQCNEQGRVFNDITGECEETCANPEHVVGADGNCGPPEEQTCDNGASNFPDCDMCPDGETSPDQHVGGNCNNDLLDTADPSDCSSGRPVGPNGEYTFGTQAWDRNCGESYCYDGTPKQTVDGAYGANCEEYVAPQPPEENPCDSNGDGVNDGTIVNGECVATPEECAKPDGTPTGATVSSGCEQCPDGYTFDFNGICQPDGGTIDCAQYNRETNEDGTCGGCLPGFQKDTSLPNEPCVAVFDGCPPGYELVNGECTAVECPEGQAYCIDTNGCEDIGTCPSDTSEEGGDAGGGGGGGGGRGRRMFEALTPAITASPQLLSRQDFPITDYLAGIFTNSTGGRNV